MNTNEPQNKEVKIDLNVITATVIASLDPRSQDIVMRRFGLATENRETLESIGREYSITRERVRQIESNAKKSLIKMKDVLSPIDKLLTDKFTLFGGLFSEDHLIDLIEPDVEATFLANKINFYLQILPAYTFVPQKSVFNAHWRQLTVLNPYSEDIVKIAETILKANDHPLEEKKLIEAIRMSLTVKEEMLPDFYIQAALKASLSCMKTVFGEWGLNSWPETSPRGVGDKAYCVMRRHTEPEHFKQITNMINEAGFGKRQANPQTVHNELIKDDRFVLVGRGLYGLKEWGYISGTVADVLESLLKKAEEPLSRDDLIEQVLKQRMVKKNTILLSLQNNKRFVKTQENRYTLKEPS